jgi:hypothetical protein
MRQERKVAMLVQENMARNKRETQLQIKSALKERSVRVACLIAESIRNALDLLDEQPPEVIEAMLEGAKEAERTGGLPKQRTALRAAILKYMEDYSLKEARAKERRLFEGITGLEEPDHA